MPLSWKELGDTPSGKKVTDTYCHLDKAHCYVNLKSDGKWHWSIFYSDRDTKAIIDGYALSLEQGRKTVEVLMSVLDKASEGC